jgi:site-specific recombinase XerD
MFNQLFFRSDALTRQLSAPLVDERRQYLAECASQGMSRQSLRAKSRLLLSIVEHLRLGHRPQDRISLAEIKEAARRWSRHNWFSAKSPYVKQSRVPEEVQRLLGVCDRKTPAGRRNYAILLLLARLGLRAGEVVALKLEDIDWRTGEINVRGKGLFHDRMPLPLDVGEAIASYLRTDRPRCQSRQVFICMKAPHRGFAGPSTLTTIVRRALAYADLHPAFKGAHLLRHSLATSMLRSGATMSEIGEVLRHREPNTTEIYAKVDFNGLRSLAHPWPIGGVR